mmetsp:Transcript_7246/g.13234  ORF Transcript_7246/g.13234 Transcript_7246/m.13234 type:complete len:150 (+) Transcript_7246:271-720(+)
MTLGASTADAVGGQECNVKNCNINLETEEEKSIRIDVERDDDDDDDDGLSDRSGRTQYWSTGTAMETDEDSSSSFAPRDSVTNSVGNVGASDDSSLVHMNEWGDEIEQIPSTEDEEEEEGGLRQYEFMPSVEDPLFPDDPFEGGFDTPL